MARGKRSNVDKAKERSKLLDMQLKEDAEKSARELRLLILGASGSGKSTVMKQMTLLSGYGYSYSEWERREYIPAILNKALVALCNILQAMNDITPSVEFGDSVRKSDSEKLLDYELLDTTAIKLPEGAADIMKRLWGDEGVQKCFLRSDEYPLCSSTKYFLDSLDRICADGFIPNEEDMMHYRVQTTGIVEETFSHNDLSFRMFDVQGQLCKERKWIHCFDDVTAIIFCADLSSYDLSVSEDDPTNRMHESMKLFDSICNNEWFKGTSIILLLNKKDLFEEKITRSTLKTCFPEYNGADESANASKYIQERFEALNRTEDREIYTNITCATDWGIENSQSVFDAIIDIIIKTHLKLCKLF